MRIKNNVNKKINSKIISFPYDINNTNNILLNSNNVFSSFVFPTDIHNNYDNQTEYKSSFVHKDINEYRSKFYNNKDKLFTISNSRRTIPYKTKDSIKKFFNNDTEIKNDKYQTKLIKSKFEYKNKKMTDTNNNSKNDFIKQKFLHKIKDGNYIFMQNKGEEKYNKINKYSNIIKYSENNITRTTNLVNNNLTCEYEIHKKKDIKHKIKLFKNSYDKERKMINNLNLRCNIKSDIYKYNTIDNNNNYKKQLNIIDNKYISLKKRESTINKLKKLRISENKKIKKNRDISDLTLDEKELKLLTKKKTYIEINNYLKYKILLTIKL